MTAANPPGTPALAAFLRAKVATGELSPDPGLEWQALRRLQSLLSRLPEPCLLELGQMPAGFVCLRLAEGDAEYVPGARDCSGRILQGVALIDAAPFIADAQPGLRALARMLDHFLGSCLSLPPRYVSDEAPGVAGWDDFHRRLLAAHRLGYADTAAARTQAGTYLQWAFAGYMLRPETLFAADPAGHRLLQSTLFSAAFWRGHPRRPRPDGAVIL